MSDTAARILRGNTQLVLRTSSVWTVHSGTVGVFAVRWQDGRPLGPRRFLFHARPGSVLFGESSSREMVLVAVGLEDARVSEQSLEEFLSGDRQTGGVRLESWIRSLCSAMASEVRVVRCSRCTTGQEVRLEPGERLRPISQSVLWLRLRDGAAKLFDHDELELSIDDDGWLPISGDVWLAATETSILETMSTEQAWSADLVRGGLSRLYDLCHRQVAVQEEEALAAGRERLIERDKLLSRETTAALAQLSAVLEPATHAEPQPTELLAALAVIGREIGISFLPPARSEDARREDDPVAAIARASHVHVRHVTLRGKWWRSDGGPLLAYLDEEHRPIALLFGGGRYIAVDPRDGSRTPVYRRLGERISPRAYSFVRPLPETRTSSLIELVRFAIRPYRGMILGMMALAAVSALLGMLVPVAHRIIIDLAIPDANMQLLYQLAAGLAAMAIGQTATSFAHQLQSLRLSTRVTADLQAGTLDRLLRLPGRFFREFSSGDLMNRTMMVSEVSGEVGGTALSAVLSGAMSLLNLLLCFYYSPPLALLALTVAAVTSLFTATIAWMIRRQALELERLGGKFFGFTVQLVMGVAKLRVAGAEQRAFNQWAQRYAEQLRLTSRIQQLNDWSTLINQFIKTASLAALFYFAVRMLSPAAGRDPLAVTAGTLLTMGTFLAFRAAFDSLVGGITSLSNTIVDITDSLAKRNLIRPLLEAKPETDATRSDPGRLSGQVVVSNVVFRYRADGPLVLDEVSLRAEPGSFIAIVGPSGCGKSTLLRILLGFETPESGTVYFDNQDLAGLDLAAVRRQIGSVLQSGRINAGSILENITVGVNADIEEIMEAVVDSGMAIDLDQMPMGIQTVVSEGGSNLSGGQRQRLLIARALVADPRILIFDEATSALDNRTQQVVAASVQRRQATRVVVAHRLSTIRHADRIFVMQAGRVVQQGSYAELIQQEGLFRRMVARQTTVVDR